MKQPHIPILKVFDDFKFNLGKNTLADYIKGDQNKTIEKNNLDELNSYGCLYMYEKNEILTILTLLIKNKYLEIQSLASGHQIVVRTKTGLKEIFEKKFIPEEIKHKKIKKELFKETTITNEDKKIFKVFDFFLKKFNDEQKKAIISTEKNILCIAGAGSGKTSVLTKRIELLTKFRGIEQKKVLAITFTKKAKEEMQTRLKELETEIVQVETFNSFAEKHLKKYGTKIYGKEVQVAKYKDKIIIVKNAITKANTNFEIFIDDYFTKKQIREKSKDELFFIFVNDVFSIIDYYKNKKGEVMKFYEKERNSTKKRIAKAIYEIAIIAQKELKKKGLRDFTDQIIDCIELFKKHKELIPEYEYVLVDEFQDVNQLQIDLIKILNAKNNFAVGDPRQAIYGWRGSEIRFILEYDKIFEKPEIIQLKKNYRSPKDIIDFFNLTIKDMGLVGLESTKNTISKNIFLIEQDNEMLEKRFVLEAIKNSSSKREEIFVLARTNKTLDDYAKFFSQNGLGFAIKSEEEYKNENPSENQITLATVHSIKGMQANEVFLVNTNSNSFPNKVQDNFVLALVKDDEEYDKESEELRLFYVALSRAKEKLIITYTKNYSKFITDEMLKFTNYKKKNKSVFDFGTEHKKLDNSNLGILKNMMKDWRSQKANETNLPHYMILSNNTIDELCARLPKTKLQLNQVNGLGEIKILKYGDEILRIING
ncbi:MAG: UvrD-helicase domain-containing protein [Candidatus Woesearchaeota archaeon]|nr:UvrD-helicase domain-containing protein [Candidatus Woesearchaeota archaeon]